MFENCKCDIKLLVVPEGSQQRREGGNGLEDQAFVFIGMRLERRRRLEMKSGYARIEFNKNRRRRWRVATLQDGV